MPIVSALLLQEAISFDKDDDDSARTNRVEFVHQIMHVKDSRVQVRSWGLTSRQKVQGLRHVLRPRVAFSH